MEERKYYISLDGRPFEVSRELYEAYYKGERKEKYFMHDLKEERVIVDKATGTATVIRTGCMEAGRQGIVIEEAKV